MEYKKGWFWLCPIWWNQRVKELKPRYKFLSWLFEMTLFMHNSMLFVSDILGLDIEPGYPIKITE